LAELEGDHDELRAVSKQVHLTAFFLVVTGAATPGSSMGVLRQGAGADF